MVGIRVGGRRCGINAAGKSEGRRRGGRALGVGPGLAAASVARRTRREDSYRRGLLAGRWQ